MLFVFVLFAPFSARSEELPIVTSVHVKGLKRIDEGAVISKASQKVGIPLSSEKTTEDIKAIYKMGYFDDVKVEIEPFEGGVVVTYVVKEKPTIVRVDFQGNKELEEQSLKEKITLTPGAISDITLINENALKIKAYYEDEGYYLAQVVPVLRNISESEVAVTFQIAEGEKVRIREIRISGNAAISAGSIKGAMQTKERGMLSFITGGGYYKKETMRSDIDRIKDLYYNSGYLKVTVGDPLVQLAEDKKGMTISIALSEGVQFRVSQVDLVGNKAFPEQEVRGLVKTAPGAVFNKETLRKDVSAISELYTNIGYAMISVTPDLVPDESKKEVKVVYSIEEGDKYKVGRIEISGNTKTLDKVIRREIRVDEGDYFNGSALKRSYERLNNTQYFESVEITPKPRAEGKVVDLDVKVKERPTGFISIGGGYSSLDKVIAMADVTQGNLFGKGETVKLKGEMGGASNYYEFSFRDPWFFDKPISFGASIYRTEREYGDFDRRSTGLGFSFGKSFLEYWGASIAYNFERATIFNVEPTASSIVKDQEGTKTTSSITWTVGRDTRDNYLDPTRGSKNSAHLTFAGLGGSNSFLKTEFDTSWYFPLFTVTTVHLRGSIGYATGLFDKNLPLYENFFVGGINTVRGLEYGKGGPLDINGEAIGGSKDLVLNAEYIFPILPEYKFKGLVFFDAGRAYGSDETFGSDLRYTAGAGIRWISPMGPIRIEWGYNLDKREGESSSKVEFAFGSFF
ncbi:MAG: outer membrane protein assembly factor BamA [Nitrospirales bacterium]|nr:outer membrane protein assembly factor BamA [Nitrospirales bacterium]